MDDLLPIDDTPVLDRSTLERWATCPRQAALMADVKSANLIAATGTEIHEAFRLTVQSYVESRGSLSRRDLVDETLTNLMQSRPDVQPDVIAGARNAVWGFADILCDVHFSAIMRHDGGSGARSGQLAMDIAAGCRVTGEVDLLLATESKEVVRLWDYKTGHFRWNETSVAKAFQFQVYASLVMENYPEVECVRTSIFNTRTNSPTYAVEFTRDQLMQYRSRISNAAGQWFQHHRKQPEQVPAWPARDKCVDCDVIARCTACDVDLAEVAKNPAAAVTLLSRMEEKSEAVRKQLLSIVKSTGQDIRADDGTCFGFCKPKADRKPTAALYVAGKATAEDQ